MEERKYYSEESSITKDSLFKRIKPVLGHLDLELTERCNNNCVHCYINLPVHDPQAKERELTTREIKEILVDATALGCLKVRFTGGEPLLREDFQDLYLFARKLGIRVIIFTNGTLITPELAGLLAKIPALEPMEITVYGMKKRTYEAVSRVKGSYEKFRQGVDLLLEYNIPFVVKAAFLPQNREDQEEFEAWAKTIPWMEEKPPRYSMAFDLRARRDSKQKNRFIKSLRVSTEDQMKSLTREGEKYILEMKDFSKKFMGVRGDLLLRCGAGKGSGTIDAYGKLQPCLLLRHPDVVYDLKNGSLEDAMIRFFPVIREIRAKDPTYLERCARCFLKGLCDQCPAKSWMEHGTLDTPVEHICEIAHAKARHLGILGKSENAWEVEDGKERLMRFSQEK